MAIRFSRPQNRLIKSDLQGLTFLEGAAGTGKTTVGVRRLRHLIKSGIPAGSILVIVPQRTLAIPYDIELRDPKLEAGGRATIATIGSLALNMVDIFWPLVAAQAGFHHPERRPVFLSLETAQYIMTTVVGALIDENHYFDSITISRSRLYSQILDNLNKAAVVGFPYSEIGERLRTAWSGEISQQRIYNEAQTCADRFRGYCLEHNLLDFSLQVELFMDYLWPMPEVRDYLTARFTHLIVDNVEEDNPAMHHVVNEWLPQTTSALVIYDTDAGYRRFLGADPVNGYRFKAVCDNQVELTRVFVASPELQAFGSQLARSLNRAVPAMKNGADPRDALIFDDHRYHPQMIDHIADEIASLVHDHGVAPREIVVLAPFLSDALRFALMNRLSERDVPARSHRPSRALREEPAARCLITLAQIAHPDWSRRPGTFDVAYAFMQALEGIDLVRAQLLAGIVYRKDGTLSPFENITQANMQQRITYALGERYEALRHWIEAYKAASSPELDFFFSRLFGEMLSQAGYGFHNDFDAARVAANLIDSARNFRRTLATVSLDKPVAQEYVEMVGQGIIADQYLRDWNMEEANAVLLAPAYTFLMSNRPVDYQFWLNAGAGGWWERLYQPLTHPYVLSLAWEPGRAWTDADEYEVRQEALYRLVLGLIRRCRQRIYLGFSQLGESGYEQRGPLLEAVQRMLRRLSQQER